MESRLCLALATGPLRTRGARQSLSFFLCEAGVMPLGEFHSALSPGSMACHLQTPWQSPGLSHTPPHSPEALPPHRCRGSEAGTQRHLLPRGRVQWPRPRLGQAV